MVDQASVKGGKSNNGSPEARVVGGIAEFGNDIATLVELQSKLTTMDVKDCFARAMVPLALCAVGLVLILGALPVVLVGAAELIAAALKLSHGWALLLTGGIVLIASAAIAVISARKIGASLSSFQRSREELNRNIAWVRTVLMHSGRSLPRRLR